MLRGGHLVSTVAYMLLMQAEVTYLQSLYLCDYVNIVYPTSAAMAEVKQSCSYAALCLKVGQPIGSLLEKAYITFNVKNLI